MTKWKKRNMWTSSSNSWTKYHPWAAGHPVARRFCRDQKTHPPIAGEIASDRWHWHLATQVGFRWIVATFFLRRFHVSSWAARHRARNALHLDSPDFGAHEGQQPGDGWKMLEDVGTWCSWGHQKSFLPAGPPRCCEMLRGGLWSSWNTLISTVKQCLTKKKKT